jgi:hypothetical protein
MTHKIIFLPCGGTARWDSESDMGYRCMDCFAMLGSVGQPKRCQEESQKWKTLETLGGKGWDYAKGEQRA